MEQNSHRIDRRTLENRISSAIHPVASSAPPSFFRLPCSSARHRISSMRIKLNSTSASSNTFLPLGIGFLVRSFSFSFWAPFCILSCRCFQPLGASAETTNVLNSVVNAMMTPLTRERYQDEKRRSRSRTKRRVRTHRTGK